MNSYISTTRIRYPQTAPASHGEASRLGIEELRVSRKDLDRVSRSGRRINSFSEVDRPDVLRLASNAFDINSAFVPAVSGLNADGVRRSNLNSIVRIVLNVKFTPSHQLESFGEPSIGSLLEVSGRTPHFGDSESGGSGLEWQRFCQFGRRHMTRNRRSRGSKRDGRLWLSHRGRRCNFGLMRLWRPGGGYSTAQNRQKNIETGSTDHNGKNFDVESRAIHARDSIKSAGSVAVTAATGARS